MAQWKSKLVQSFFIEIFVYLTYAERQQNVALFSCAIALQRTLY